MRVTDSGVSVGSEGPSGGVALATEAGRAKDRDDVRNIIAVRGAELDWTYTERWCTTHGTRALLGEIRDSLPPS